MTHKYKNSLFDLFSIVLDLPKEKLSLSTNIDDTDKWDSLSHVKIIMEVENKFKINLSPEEALDITSIKDVYEILNKKIINKEF